MQPFQDSLLQTGSGLRSMDTAQLNLVFRQMERREREMDSLARLDSAPAAIRVLPPPKPKGFDTASLPYLYGPDSFGMPENPLEPFQSELFHPKDSAKAVFIESAGAAVEVPATSPEASHSGHDPNPDWMLFLIIGSLVLLAWIKLFYNKFLDQTMQAVRNFQLSLKLHRDQNLFSRRVALLLNVHFALIGGAFLYLVLSHFNLKPWPVSDLLSYLIYAGIILLAMLLRYIVSHLTGFLFLQSPIFQQYLHQIFLLYKNLGIYLVVFVIGISYLNEPYSEYLIYIGLILVMAAFLLRFIKGIQLLIKKDVLIFYLILYLCSLEFLPLVIFYKFISSSGMTG